MPIAIPIAIAGAQTAATLGAQAWSNAGNIKRQREAFRQNLAMWNLQNEYNTPKAQMARYREAGLNPNLMYGQGNPGNATQMAKYNAPEMSISMPDIIGMIGQYQNSKLIAEQTKNVQADTALKVQERSIKELDKIIKQYEEELAFESSSALLELEEREGRKAPKRYWLEQDKAEAIKMRNKIMELGIKQTEKFMKYMDYSQIGGIAGDVMKVIGPIMNLIGVLRGQNLK